MPVNETKYQEIITELKAGKVQLVAVSKLQPVVDIKKLYDLGQRDFGENYVQELLEKQSLLPEDINWHFIGHLQTNKVKLIVPFVWLIQGVDSFKLLSEINKQAKKLDKKISCLLQVHIAQEETKFGLDEAELNEIFTALKEDPHHFVNVSVDGLMGMASFSNDLEIVKREMGHLQSLFEKHKNDLNEPLTVLSMGMSGDYKTAVSLGSNMVRIGSLLFGARH